MKKIILIIALAFCVFALFACGSTDSGNSFENVNASGENTMENKSLILLIGSTKVNVAWENNDSVSALKRLAANGLTVDMRMYGGFEQVGSLGRSLPSKDREITATAGDIVLYSSNQIVLFYGSNTWRYTKLGRIDLSGDELTNLLGNGNVTIYLTVE